MQTKVLETQIHPFVLVPVRGANGGAGTQSVAVAITLHGTTQTLQAPVTIESSAGSVNVGGKLTLAQSQFGIVPFSILAGAIQVQDALALHFEIRATRMQ